MCFFKGAKSCQFPISRLCAFHLFLRTPRPRTFYPRRWSASRFAVVLLSLPWQCRVSLAKTMSNNSTCKQSVQEDGYWQMLLELPTIKQSISGTSHISTFSFFWTAKTVPIFVCVASFKVGSVWPHKRLGCRKNRSDELESSWEDPDPKSVRVHAMQHAKTTPPSQ